MRPMLIPESVLLSDALERAYAPLLSGNPRSPLLLRKGLRALGRALRHAVRTTGRLVAVVLEADAEARANAVRCHHASR